MILGSIGYYCFTTASQTQTVASEQQAHEHELFDGGEEIHDHDNVHGNDQGNALENEHHNYTHEETTTKSTAQQYFEWEINEEIQILREYLRIKSVHPDINYSNINFPIFDQTPSNMCIVYLSNSYRSFSRMRLLFGRLSCKFRSFVCSSLSIR